MISNKVIQADMVAWLKTQGTLTTLLAGGTSDEVREEQYQGTVFGYPAVRLAVLNQAPITEREHCDHARLTVTVRCYAEGASSRPVDILAGVVNDLLHRKQFRGTGWYTTFYSSGLVGAVRLNEKLWRSEAMFTGVVYPTTTP